MTNEEAIEWLSAMRDRNDYQRKEALDMAIESLKQNQWIPCSERLPSKGMPVLVNGIMEGAPPMTISTDAPHYYKEGWINAWMPLPKPYEGGTE